MCKVYTILCIFINFDIEFQPKGQSQYRKISDISKTPDQDLSLYSLAIIKENRNELSQQSHQFLQETLQEYLNRLQNGCFQVNVELTEQGTRRLPEQPPSIILRNQWHNL